MKKKTQLIATQEDILVDLTLHQVPASILTDFAEKIVRPYYGGNLTTAIQDLINKSLVEQDFVHAHIAQIRTR